MIIIVAPQQIRRESAPRPALFLDRDGVINVDHGWVHRRDDVVWVDGIVDLVRWAVDLALPVVVVTNQGGIARGLYNEVAFRSLSNWMLEQFAQWGAPIDLIVGCPHHPAGAVARFAVACQCRKPAPGMLLRAAKILNLDLGRSVMVGDKPSDMAAAEAAGIGDRILLAQMGSGEHRSISSLSEVLRHLRTRPRWDLVPRE